MLQPQGEDHLALPQGDGIHQRGLDLLQHQSVVVLDEPGLGAHLDGDHPGQLQVVELLFKPGAQIGQIVVGLGVLLAPAQLLQLHRAGLFQLLLAGQDIHGQLFVVLGVELVHLVQHGHVLHQGDLVILQHLHDLVYVGLGLGVLGLHGVEVVFLLLEEAKDPLLLLLTKVLQLAHQAGQSVAHLAQILGPHRIEGVFREGGDVLLGGGAVLKDHVGVSDVDLLGEVVDHLPLGVGELALVQLDGVLVPSLLGGGSVLGGEGGLQGQVGGLGSLSSGGGVGGEGQLGGEVGIVSHVGASFLISSFRFIAAPRGAILPPAPPGPACFPLR